MVALAMFVPACGEREKIIAEIHKAIHGIMEIHRAEPEPGMAGNLKRRDDSIELRLRELPEHKALLMDRLHRHCAQHGCAG